MTPSLTIAYITSRKSPHFEWFIQSLDSQLLAGQKINVILVDALFKERDGLLYYPFLEDCSFARRILHIAPKPNIWQGEHRATAQDWWAASNARNTAICCCQTDWIAFVDDRSVLLPNWLACVEAAMKQGYAVCGSYEKVINLKVEAGRVITYEEPTNEKAIPSGKDCRLNAPDLQKNGASLCPGAWWFGCANAVPMEWALAVNGYDETCDGVSMEDVIFGIMLKNNGYPICFDPRMKMLEDRTPGTLEPLMRREDKGKSPDDKSHAMLKMLEGSKRALHPVDLRAVREQVLNGGKFPLPKGPYRDWYDGEVIDQNYMVKK